MDKNVKIAKELVRIAKSLVAQNVLEADKGALDNTITIGSMKTAQMIEIPLEVKRSIPRANEGKTTYGITIYDKPDCNWETSKWGHIEIDADSVEDAIKKVNAAGWYTRKTDVRRMAYPDWDKYPDRDWCNN